MKVNTFATKLACGFIAAMLIVGLLPTLSVKAETSGDYTYTVLEDGTAEITGYNGKDSDLVVPSEIDSYTVTSIGDKAFGYKQSIVYATLPEGITRIGKQAFQGCPRLQRVYIPGSVRSIGDEAFASCTILEMLTISEGVEEIGTSAFQWCYRLGNLTLPDSLKSIGEKSFAQCTNLKSIEIPAGVTAFNHTAFQLCTRLAEVSVDPDNAVYDSREDCNAVIESNTNTLVFGCTNTVIPNGVTRIGEKAFYQCTSLSEINIPESVTYIGNDAFSNCENLTKIELPDSITDLGEYVFSGCKKLESVKLPEGITTISRGMFSGCSTLGAISLPQSVTDIGEYAFRNCSGFNRIVIPDNIIRIGSNSFSDCANAEEIVIGSAVTSIGGNAFYGIPNLKRVVVPKNVTEIRAQAFGYYGASTITKIIGFTICGEKGTAAETYAQNNGFTFEEVTQADYSAVEAALAKIPEDLSIYTEDSVAVLQEAIDSVDYSKMSYQQEAVDLMAATIEEAIASLEIKHVHSLVKTEAVPAKEKTAGNTEYWYCEGCGKYFADAAAEQEIEEGSWVIPATGIHEHVMVHVAAVPAAEGVEGNTEYWYCEDCGKYYSDALAENEIAEGSWVIPALPVHVHALTHIAATPAKEKTAGNTEYWYCEGCGKYFADAAAEQEIEEGSWVIPATGIHEHVLRHVAAKAETAGADGNTEYWYCADCGKYYADAEAKTEIAEGSWVIPAYGYSTVTLPQSRSIMTTEQVIELKPEVSGHSTQLTWKSSKPSVATVDKNGVVKAIEPGTAKISVTVKDGNTATFTVTVKDYSYKAEADMRAIKREYPHAQGTLGYVYAYTNLDGEDIVLTHVGYKIKSLFHADYMHNMTTGRTYQDSGIASYFQTNIDRSFGVTKLHWMELQNEELKASARMLAGKGYVFRYNKYENPMTVKAKAVTVKYSAVKKKAVTIAKKKAFTIKKAQGKVTFKKAKGNKKITISKTGVITVKKGLKKGTYKVKIKVTAAGNGNYKSKSKTVTVTIKVK